MNIKTAIANDVKLAAEFKASRYNDNTFKAYTGTVDDVKLMNSPDNRISYAILPTKDRQYDVLDNNKNIIKTFDDYDSAQAFAKKHKFASGDVYSKLASDASNPFTQALAKILSGRMPTTEANTLRTPDNIKSETKIYDEPIGNVLMQLNPANILNKTLGE